MRKIFTLIGLLMVSLYYKGIAQSIYFTKDTVTITSAGPVNLVDTVRNTTTGVINPTWSVVSTNFPADWQASASICDVPNCYPFSNLWPSGSLKTATYSPGIGDFHLQIDMSAVTTVGCFYVKVKMSNPANTDTSVAVFKICKSPAAVSSVKATDEVTLYPNPATSELNVVYSPSADIKNIAVYNIIGKALAVYKVTNNNSANLNLENIPAGIYFVRLMNSHGEVVVTRKFTKQ